MGLKVHTDDAIARSEELDIRPEHLDRSETAVQEDERLAVAEFLVAELDARLDAIEQRRREPGWFRSA